MVSAAVAFRLFLFFVPLLLFLVGILGFFSSAVSERDVSDAGLSGGIADQINTALSQPNSTRWIAVLVGTVRHGDHRSDPEQDHGRGELPGLAAADAAEGPQSRPWARSSG